MKTLPNYNFSKITSYSTALVEIENHIHLLMKVIDECDETFTEEDRETLIININWLKRFYEAAERCLLNDK